MHDDEDIDFEQVFDEEKEKIREQERKDAELAKKLLEDELDRQEQE